jgi:hypothetical protein
MHYTPRAFVYNFFFTLQFIWNSLLLLINTIYFIHSCYIIDECFNIKHLFQTSFLKPA